MQSAGLCPVDSKGLKQGLAPLGLGVALLMVVVASLVQPQLAENEI